MKHDFLQAFRNIAENESEEYFFKFIIGILHFFKEYLFKRERVFLNQQRRHGVQLLFVLLRVAAIFG